MPTDQPTTPKQKLRWYQFSLRTLFILMFLVAIASSWVAVKMNQARRQKEAVQHFKDIGGKIYYDYQRIYGQYSEGLPLPAPQWLRLLLGDDFFINVQTVDLENTSVKDADLIYLKSFPKLRVLYLRNTQITDAGLEYLDGLNCCDTLLSGTNISEAGAAKYDRLGPNNRVNEYSPGSRTPE